MKILIAGGSGFIGRHLITALEQDRNKYFITILSRKVSEPRSYTYVSWEDNNLPKVIQNHDVVINLCGEPIRDRRWSPSQKKKLEESRIKITRRLVTLMNLSSKPQTLIQASAIGFYGTSGDSFIDESSRSGKDYLAQLCRKWEQEVKKLNNKHRSSIVRFGIVLGRDGGTFPKMAHPVRLGICGPLGSGWQWISWIHINDLVHMILNIIKTKSFRGVINGTAPYPVINRYFMKSIAKELHRPCLFKAPKGVLSLMLGERAMLLTKGQRVIPKRARELNFTFQYPILEVALKELLTHE